MFVIQVQGEAKNDLYKTQGEPIIILLGQSIQKPAMPGCHCSLKRTRREDTYVEKLVIDNFCDKACLPEYLRKVLV